jgi:hypothetical protein
VSPPVEGSEKSSTGWPSKLAGSFKNLLSNALQRVH